MAPILGEIALFVTQVILCFQSYVYLNISFKLFQGARDRFCSSAAPNEYQASMRTSPGYVSVEVWESLLSSAAA